MPPKTLLYYHAGEAYAAMRRELEWDSLTPHARSTMLRCMDEEQANARDLSATSSEAARFESWMHCVCCEATPSTAVVENCFTCDRVFAGGRLLLYRCRTLVVIGGSHAPAQHTTPPPSLYRYQRGEEHDGEKTGAFGGPHAAISCLFSSPSWAGDLPDHSRVHEATELRPLIVPMRVLGATGAALALAGGGTGGLCRVRTKGTDVAACVLPPLEGCAVAAYGACILVHGGCSTLGGEATDEMRALRMQPDPSRAGEYGIYGKVRVQQEHGVGVREGGEVGGSGAALPAGSQPAAAAATGSAASAPAAASAPPLRTQQATAAAAAAAAEQAGGGGAQESDAPLPSQPPRRNASRPCPPPSARHGHHLAVDHVTCRLWMYGGRAGVGSSTQRGAAAARDAWLGRGASLLPPPLSLGTLSPSGVGEEPPADPQPCCYWAQLPADAEAAAAEEEDKKIAADGSGGGSGSCSNGGSGSSRAVEDGVYPGGGAVVDRVSWHCLPLRPTPSSLLSKAGARAVMGAANGAGGSFHRHPAPPNLPDPTRAAAVAVYRGGLYVLSSGLERPGVGGGSSGSGGGRRRTVSGAAAASPYRWWLHRIDLLTGRCEPLDAPAAATGPAAKTGAAAATGGGGGGITRSSCSNCSDGNVTSASVASGPEAPPPYHDDAIAMADDTLPYIYVYGATQRGNGAAALGGGSFFPSLHRVRLPDHTSAAAGSTTGGGNGGVHWEAVELLGPARLHVARGALGAVSGGSVTLLGGVRDGRRGVEPQLQRVTAAYPARAAASPATASGLGPLGDSDDDAAAAARCRRVIVERLRRVAPRQVWFAPPDATAAGSGGGSGQGLCVALAAALTLHSRSCLFDDFFEELDDKSGDGDDVEEGAYPPDRYSGGGGSGGHKRCRHGGSGGGGNARRGLTLPGHEPLAVAAVAAWVMGRTRVRPDWEPRFMGQMFRVAHLWELPALQREMVGLVARWALNPPPPPPPPLLRNPQVLPPQPPSPLLRLEQLPAAMELWAEMRRLGAVAAAAAAAATRRRQGSRVGDGGDGARGGSGSLLGERVHTALRSRLLKAASSAFPVRPDSLEELMQAAIRAEAEELRGCGASPGDTSGCGGGGCGGRSSGSSGTGPFVALQRACVRAVEELLLTSQWGGGGGVDSGGGGDTAATANAAAARVATRFACRFRVRPVLFQAMRWWRRRLAVSGHLTRDSGETLRQLLGLIEELRVLDKQQPQEQGQLHLGPSPLSSAAAVSSERAAPTQVGGRCMLDTPPSSSKRPRLTEELTVTAIAVAAFTMKSDAEQGQVHGGSHRRDKAFGGDGGGADGGGGGDVAGLSGGTAAYDGKGGGGRSSGGDSGASGGCEVPDGPRSADTVGAGEQRCAGGGGGSGGAHPPAEFSEPSLANQLVGVLWGELLRAVRPATALVVLQVLPRESEIAPYDGEMRRFVRQQAYRKLATLPAAQRLQLPASFRTPGLPDHEELRGAVTEAGAEARDRNELQSSALQREGSIGASSSGGGASNGSSRQVAVPGSAAVAAILASGQLLSRECNEWQRAQEREQIVAR